ncbi:ubiquinol-cytochrome C chaperone [Skermanella stibiiresistens SB22]|uniref:Ubiquinol-cytochrome C chaperone n=1 Tax=Skermanella stibiiresistens SB22 TaxID=1385369 RepID=W9H398_9PROT|nr:ubiquinol-cytochrome C chaperone family protein [Skermanella stibiiresistens]EWY39271.1 ubiquinol-cytochrome C chaperone [Skermanella stibiiresistens SB22]
MLKRLFQRKRPEAEALDLYDAIVAQARQPYFYAALGVPDTIDGRFEMIALHAFLVMRRLKGQGAEAAAVSQQLFDTLIADMDRSLREIGIGDLSVPKHIKNMAKGLYGRIVSYEKGLAEPGDAALHAAFDRNLYGTVMEVPEEHLAAMTSYLRREDEALKTFPLDRMVAGHVRFGPASAAAA